MHSRILTFDPLTRFLCQIVPLAFLVVLSSAAPARSQEVDAQDDYAETGFFDSVDIDVLDNDYADNGIAPSTVKIAAPPIYGTATVDIHTGVITYTPDGKYSGDDYFFYTFRDTQGELSNQAMVTVTVDAPVPPDAEDDYTETSHYDPIAIDVLANDYADYGIDPTSVEVTLPAVYGSTSIDSETGVITYTPDGQYSGDDYFFYKFRDSKGILSNEAMVTVTVDEPIYPDAEDDYPDDVPYNTPQVFWPLDNDIGYEAPIDETSLTIVTPPSQGTVTVNADGSVTYVPDDGAEYDDWFSYVVADELGNVSNEAYVYVWIDPNQAPTIWMDWEAELDGSVTFYGQVDDDQSIANLTVTFGGLLAGEGPAITDAQGNFSINVVLPADASGDATAVAEDVWGLDSDVADCFYSS